VIKAQAAAVQRHTLRGAAKACAVSFHGAVDCQGATFCTARLCRAWVTLPNIHMLPTAATMRRLMRQSQCRMQTKHSIYAAWEATQHPWLETLKPRFSKSQRSRTLPSGHTATGGWLW